MLNLPLSNELTFSKGLKPVKKCRGRQCLRRRTDEWKSVPGVLVGGTKELFQWCETCRQHLFLPLDEFNWIVHILWPACAFLLCNFNIYDIMNDIIAFYFSLWWFKSASQDETRDIIKGRKYRQEGVKRGQADCN